MLSGIRAATERINFAYGKTRLDLRSVAGHTDKAPKRLESIEWHDGLSGIRDLSTSEICSKHILDYDYVMGYSSNRSGRYDPDEKLPVSDCGCGL